MIAGSIQSKHTALLLMAASGFAGLGYQIVWTGQCALWLGHESASVLAVVAAFFGGLSIGAWIFGDRIERSRQPIRWYAACELTIALWGLVLVFVMSPASDVLLRITGAQPSAIWQWTVAFCGTLLLLLPATAAMGATLPAMERITAQLRNDGRSIAALYASNTLGAVIGVLLSTFWLIPQFGISFAALVCVMLNVVCAATAARVLVSESVIAPPVPPSLDEASRVTLIRLAITGFLGIGYEVLVVRVLSQVTEDTVYTFALLLAIYLLGSAIGAAAYQRRFAKTRDTNLARERLLYGLAIACLIGTASLWGAAKIKTLALSLFDESLAVAMSVEALLALVAFGLPTLAMGATFSHLLREALASGVTFGRAVSVNTFGASIAPIVFGAIAFPYLGPKAALLLVAAGYLSLIARSDWFTPKFFLPVSAALVGAIAAPPLAFVDVPAGGRIVSYREGVMASVSVVEDADGVARLRIDNRQQEGSSATRRVDARQAWLPLLLHPSPKRALFLGLGTGVTAGAAAEDPSLAVDAVELLPEVIAASKHFVRAEQGEYRSRMHLIAADARRFVRATDRRYDVIVSDNFHPARSGSGSLYTVEHFKAVRQRLNSDGVFCQWLPLHQLDLETLRSIVKSFLAAYPQGWALLASNSLETPVVGLVGRGDQARLDIEALRHRMNRARETYDLLQLGFEDELAIFGVFAAGPHALNAFAAGSKLNTDDRPFVAYRAPRITYAPDSLPRDRLIALLNELAIEPEELFVSVTADDATRLTGYWAARDRFIESGKDVRPSQNVLAMLAQVREPLLGVLRISPEFRPAYDPLLLMAKALVRTDPPGARVLFNELATVQPARADARLALDQLDAATR